MIARLQKSMKERDKGFTLVELLVVIVIIGILAGIAIPLFLSQRKKGVDAGVKSDLKSAATIEETYYVDANNYTEAAADFTTENFKLTSGNVIEVAAVSSPDDAYCLRGSNPDGGKTGSSATDYWFYSSDGGGLSDTATGACSGATFNATPLS